MNANLKRDLDGLHRFAICLYDPAADNIGDCVTTLWATDSTQALTLAYIYFPEYGEDPNISLTAFLLE